MIPLFSCRIHNLLHILQRRSKALSRRRETRAYCSSSTVPKLRCAYSSGYLMSAQRLSEGLAKIRMSASYFALHHQRQRFQGDYVHYRSQRKIRAYSERCSSVLRPMDFHNVRPCTLAVHPPGLSVLYKKTNPISFANKSYSLIDLSIRIACNAAS